MHAPPSAREPFADRDETWNMNCIGVHSLF
jgi:hypothetical protein